MSSTPINTSRLLSKINGNPYILSNIFQYAIGVKARLLSKQYKNIFHGSYEQNYIYKINDLSKVSDDTFNSLINNTNFKFEIRITQKTYNVQIERIKDLLKVKKPSNRIHTLYLRYCTGITDVSALGNVHTLYFYDCTGITDVSLLGNVHTLYLYDCTGITNVSALGNVHILDLFGCTGITDVSALGNVYELNLRFCTSITDVSALGNVHELKLCCCTGIIDVSVLKSVKKLYLSKNNNITTNLSEFTNIEYWL